MIRAFYKHILLSDWGVDELVDQVCVSGNTVVVFCYQFKVMVSEELGFIELK